MCDMRVWEEELIMAQQKNDRRNIASEAHLRELEMTGTRAVPQNIEDYIDSPRWIYYHKYYQCQLSHWCHMTCQSNILFCLFSRAFSFPSFQLLFGALWGPHTDWSLLLLSSVNRAEGGGGWGWGRGSFFMSRQVRIRKVWTSAPQVAQLWSWVQHLLCSISRGFKGQTRISAFQGWLKESQWVVRGFKQVTS